MLHAGLIIYHHIWIVALQLLYLCLYQTVHKAITALPLCASHYHQIIIIFLCDSVCQPCFQICLLRHSNRDLIAAVHTGSFNFLPQFSQCAFDPHTIHNRTDRTIEIKPTKVVIVEGILIFQNKALRDLLDIKIFVETDADVRILRRALRDVEERGRSMQSVVEQYLATVKPMHEQFVEPTRKYADIVVLEGGHNLVALDLIMQRIANHIAEN